MVDSDGDGSTLSEDHENGMMLYLSQARAVIWHDSMQMR